jgi:hypothetical protein
MGCKLVEKVLKICSEYGVGEKENFKKPDLKICFFMPLYLGMC